MKFLNWVDSRMWTFCVAFVAGAVAMAYTIGSDEPQPTPKPDPASVLTKHEAKMLENVHRMYLDWDAGKSEEQRFWKDLDTKIGAIRLPDVRKVK